MLDVTARTRRIEALVTLSEDFEDRVARWQVDASQIPDAADVRAARREYSVWYAAAQRDVPEADRSRFVDMYEGGSFTKRIRAFLTTPLEESPLYNPADPASPFPRWQLPFTSAFQECMAVQRDILIGSLGGVSALNEAVDELTTTFRRFPNYLAALRVSDRATVPAPTIEVEADLQVLLHAILRLLFEDVRREDAVPQHAGGASRVDFILPTAGIVVETKMTRKGLTDRPLGQELIIDWARYAKHPDCQAIVALVYDPERRLSNPAGLENDLSHDDENPIKRVVIIH